MQSTETVGLIEPNPRQRQLQIEEVGDFWRGHIKPKIRLMGHWLEQAGFKPGHRVNVRCVAIGVIEMRCETNSK